MRAVPAATPDTTPEVPTVATMLLLLVHVPPEGVAINELVVPTHRVVVPVMALGAEFTVTTIVFWQLAVIL